MGVLFLGVSQVRGASQNQTEVRSDSVITLLMPDLGAALQREL